LIEPIALLYDIRQTRCALYANLRGVASPPMKEMAVLSDTTGKALQVLDTMLEFFADDNYWARGHYHDPHGRHCLVGAVLYFSAKHGLPRAPVMSLLEAALPWRQMGLIAFNDRLCHSVAELRSIILKAQALALENAKHEQAAAAFKNRLLAERDRDRALRGAARDEAEELSVPCTAACSLDLSDPAEPNTAAVPRTVPPGGIAESIAADFYDARYPIPGTALDPTTALRFHR
jgi:hypothetical protein